MQEIVGDVLQDKAVRDMIIVSYLRKTICFFANSLVLSIKKIKGF